MSGRDLLLVEDEDSPEVPSFGLFLLGIAAAVAALFLGGTAGGVADDDVPVAVVMLESRLTRGGKLKLTG